MPKSGAPGYAPRYAQGDPLTARVLHWVTAALVMFTVHRAMGIAIALLLCAHLGAVLYHHFIRKDGVLVRMVSG